MGTNLEFASQKSFIACAWCDQIILVVIVIWTSAIQGPISPGED